MNVSRHIAIKQAWREIIPPKRALGCMCKALVEKTQLQRLVIDARATDRVAWKQLLKPTTPMARGHGPIQMTMQYVIDSFAATLRWAAGGRTTELA